LPFLSKILLVFAKIGSNIRLVDEKCAILVAENWQKLQKIVIRTSTPEAFKKVHVKNYFSIGEYYKLCQVPGIEWTSGNFG
jgi:hypothetical protein